MDNLLDQAEALQNLLVSRATGGPAENGDYLSLRGALMAEPALEPLVPRFVRTCRDLYQFWQYIKGKFPSYAERRDYLWEEFRPLCEQLEQRARSPADDYVFESLRELNAEQVGAVWARALERRLTDPQGAMTMARTLLETVCKHILDDLAIQYVENADLPKLYRAVAQALELAPNQQTEPVLRQVLGGCTAIVEGLGALRNRLVNRQS